MKKTNHSSIFSIAGRACLLLIAAYGLSPSSVKAQCASWDVGGAWDAVITPLVVEHLTLQHTRTGVSGSARVDNGENPYDPNGIVKGTVQGNQVQIIVSWKRPSGTASEGFEGTIGQDGKIVGQAQILAIAGFVRTNWASSRPMRCLSNVIHGLKIKPRP